MAKLSLDRPATYEIRVQGQLNGDWAEWFDNMTVSWEASETPATVLTGPVTDQAALFGLLSRLYGLGLPLLSLRCLDSAIHS